MTDDSDWTSGNAAVLTVNDSTQPGLSKAVGGGTATANASMTAYVYPRDGQQCNPQEVPAQASGQANVCSYSLEPLEIKGYCNGTLNGTGNIDTTFDPGTCSAGKITQASWDETGDVELRDSSEGCAITTGGIVKCAANYTASSTPPAPPLKSGDIAGVIMLTQGIQFSGIVGPPDVQTVYIDVVCH